ncbi:CheR family methyltransferase [Leptothoe sp. PORK10 BA2]|uniref:CheR family methyltransferase n=1 Tax=Leptothoe sp. PORK10 BA2 TaxID=3110254 RepID=UPI002B2115B2|nr:CheR family methyltransferase [Leptothoe sp. PORK10 BA2]MEA5462428.1 CheR family methyltransferase [Leptothoe sp. PORK10 BA2]
MTPPQDEAQTFEALLEFLRHSRGFDFTGYKRSSLQRRVTKQMQTRNLDTFGEYLDYLEVHPEEFTALFNTILINVTSFFRDQPAWDYLWHELLPDLLLAKPPDEPIRIWSAGCASGEEAYTVAMVLTEILGPVQFRQRVKIYATDVDDEALAEARHASYPASALEAIPPALRNKYFEPLTEGTYAFRTDLRRSVIFGRHDLVQDAPISRLDLLICRNALMYFNAETQGRILARLHFALNPAGAIFLGKAEMLLTHGNLFTPINLQHRIFKKVSSVSRRDHLLVLSQSGDQEASGRLVEQGQLRDAAFNVGAVAQIVVDRTGNLIIANHLARSTFGINRQDLGRPLQDLEISYRPLELRSLIEQVYAGQQPSLLQDVARTLPDDTIQFLDVQLTPLRENDSELLGVSISFTDVTLYHDLQTEVQRSSQDLETANEELQSSNEELETTNEELQSTNEELETTNEELQSTNEELETMNEELQSTNEELQTINDELRLRTNEANQANAYLNSILASINAGVAVLDRQFNILTWNQQTEDFWGLRTEEVEGQSFWNLDIGLPVDQLREAIRACLNGADRTEVVLETINRRGQAFTCRVTCTPLIGVDNQRQGVILLMERDSPSSEL